MQKDKFKILRVLSILISALTIFASVGGILLDNLYRDNPFVTLVWKTTDAVTLFVAVPILAAGLYFSSRGSARGLLVLLAMLDYTFYNSAYYLFGASFNWFFLIYVAIVVLSAAALIVGLIEIDASWLKRQFQEKTPVRWISGYMLFVAVGLTAIYLMMIFALDLTMVVPVFLIGAVWLWKRKPWGFVLGGISVIKGAVYTLVLTVVTIAASNGGFPESASEIPLWATLSASGIVASLVLLMNLKSHPESASHLST